MRPPSKTLPSASLGRPAVRLRVHLDGRVGLRLPRRELLSVTTVDGNIGLTVPAGPYEVIVDSEEGEVLLSPEIEEDPSATNRIELSSERGSIYVRASSEPEA